MPGAAPRRRCAALALALLQITAGWQRPAVRCVRPRTTPLRATDTDEEAPAKPQAPSFMDSMQSFFKPKPAANTTAAAQKAKADAEGKTDADVSEEQRRVAEAVVE